MLCIVQNTSLSLVTLEPCCISNTYIQYYYLYILLKLYVQRVLLARLHQILSRDGRPASLLGDSHQANKPRGERRSES